MISNHDKASLTKKFVKFSQEYFAWALRFLTAVVQAILVAITTTLGATVWVTILLPGQKIDPLEKLLAILFYVILIGLGLSRFTVAMFKSKGDELMKWQDLAPGPWWKIYWDFIALGVIIGLASVFLSTL